MKILVIGLLFSTALFAQETIKNGKFELTVNGNVLQTSVCETYKDGNYAGIKNLYGGSVFTVSEVDLKEGTQTSESPLTVTSTTKGLVSAQGFCSMQDFLSGLKITYRQDKDQTQIVYNYRCNAKTYTRTLTCIR